MRDTSEGICVRHLLSATKPEGETNQSVKTKAATTLVGAENSSDDAADYTVTAALWPDSHKCESKKLQQGKSWHW